MQIHNQVMDQYLEIGRDDPENVVVVDRDDPEEDQVREEEPGLASEVPDPVSCPSFTLVTGVTRMSLVVSG